TGNMALPAIVTCAGAAVLIPVSPCLIFGWGPFPRLGVAGGAVAVVAYYAVGSVALAAYLWSGRSVVRLAWAGLRFRWPQCRGSPACLAVVVRHRSCHARRWSTLSAHGRSTLRSVRTGHGPLLRVARCRTAALAAAGEPDAAGDCRRRRQAGAALER